MDTSLKIILVEDNDDLRDLLAREISKSGYAVQNAGCAEDLDDATATKAFDVLILDINLPGENGLDIARRYKQSNPDIYIIMLTARVGTEDKVIGYEAGADIYLTKPVASVELLAAIRSVGRRLQSQQHADSKVVLNVREMTLTGDKAVELNRQETAMLKALSESPNGNLPYYRLLELCGEEVNATSKATLEVRIVRLRKKLAEAGLEGKTIKAIRGDGYQLLSRIAIN
jgi:two-component system phosphate regulon response regulator OmpR